MNSNKSPQRAAALPRRLAALLYDALAVAALMFAVAALAITLNQGQAVEGRAVWLLRLVLAGVWFGYLGLSWKLGGQTLGMRAWRLRLISDTGRSISLLQVLARWIGGSLGFLAAGLGYGWGLFRTDRRTWPDLFSGTRIVRI